MDAKTGQVLYEQNAHTEWPPASTTKIMTALVALERAPLDTWITISGPVAHFREERSSGSRSMRGFACETSCMP